MTIFPACVLLYSKAVGLSLYSVKGTQYLLSITWFTAAIFSQSTGKVADVSVG